jgi:hypothetical protein
MVLHLVTCFWRFSQVLGKGIDERMPELRSMHRRIMANLDEMCERKEAVVQEHEHNLLRHFRAKLFEVR